MYFSAPWVFFPLQYLYLTVCSHWMMVTVGVVTTCRFLKVSKQNHSLKALSIGDVFSIHPVIFRQANANCFRHVDLSYRLPRISLPIRT